MGEGKLHWVVTLNRRNRALFFALLLPVLATHLVAIGAGPLMWSLLPALVGAFLGSTTIRPGRVNVWGTLVGICVLAIGIAGIQQFGGAFWVEPLFNGATLLLSISFAGFAQRRRLANQKSVQHASGKAKSTGGK